LENKEEKTFLRIDGALDESLLDASREKNILDSDGKTTSSRIATFIQNTLDSVTVEAKSLTADHVPGIVVLDENQRRFRDYMTLTQGQKGIPTKKTFVV